MQGLRQDSLQEDKHTRLKRWERQAQFSALRRRGEEDAFSLPCRWRSGSAAPVFVRSAQILALFQGDIALVRFAGDARDGMRLLRDGLPWERCLPVLLRAYQRGVRVCQPLMPRRRIPPVLIQNALGWPAAGQAEFFAALRKSGVLPNPPKLDAESLSPWLPWEEAKERFLDFRGGGEAPGIFRDMPRSE